MATRNTKLSVQIEADDNASRVIRDVQGEARELDKLDPEIEVTVDDQASGKLAGLTDKLGGLGGLAAGAGVAGILALADSAADAAIDAQVLSDATGTSLDNASRLQTVFRTTADVDAKDLFDIIREMNDKLAENPELVTELGIEYDAAKDPVQSFIDVVDAIGESTLTNNEKVKLMGELFGDEGVSQVQRVITIVGDLGTAIDDVPSLATVDQADVDRAIEYKKQMAEVQAIYQNLATNYVDLFFKQGPVQAVQTVANTNSPQWRAVQNLFGAGGTTDTQESAAGLVTSRVAELVGSVVNIINPAGTPATTADQLRQYSSRNGDGRDLP